MSDPEKVRENRLRRMARRQGLALRKSRRRDTRAVDYGQYLLVDARLNAAVAQPLASLDQVEEILAPEEE